MINRTRIIPWFSLLTAVFGGVAPLRLHQRADQVVSPRDLVAFRLIPRPIRPVVLLLAASIARLWIRIASVRPRVTPWRFFRAPRRDGSLLL